MPFAPPKLEPMPEDVPGVRTVRLTVLDVLRFLTELVTIASLAVWGFFAWPMPWSIVLGIGAPLLAIVLWALFVSPKAVFAVHPFVRVLVELLIFLSATIAWWAFGHPWIGLAIGAVSVAIGVLHGRRRLSA
ncbi:YrdB family protein [Microbacterium marinilacus]|uniref:YrdB family protein n=2 Tax=Microbacterium marinilacus TaxID=415209 RepID=A0ABP7BEH7_9MICO